MKLPREMRERKVILLRHEVITCYSVGTIKTATSFPLNANSPLRSAYTLACMCPDLGTFCHSHFSRTEFSIHCSYFLIHYKLSYRAVYTLRWSIYCQSQTLHPVTCWGCFSCPLQLHVLFILQVCKISMCSNIDIFLLKKRRKYLIFLYVTFLTADKYMFSDLHDALAAAQNYYTALTF